MSRRQLHARRIGLAAALTVAFVFAGPGEAQLPIPGKAADPKEAEAVAVTPESLAADREQIAAEIEKLRAEGNGGAAARERLALLERLDRTLATHHDSLVELRGRSRADASGSSLIGGEPPYPFALYEATSQALDIHRRQLALMSEQLKSRKQELERLATEVEVAERERRRAKERAETGTDALARAQWAQTLRRLAIESRIVKAELAQGRTRVESDTEELAAQRQQAEVLEATLAKVRSRLAVTRYDLDEPLNRIALAEERARMSAEQARAELASAERMLADAQLRRDGSPSPPPALQAELEARQRRVQLAQERINASETRLEQLGLERSLWDRRIQALRGEAGEQLPAWSEEVERELDRLRRMERLEATHRDAMTQEASRLRSALASAPEPSAEWIRRQLETTEALEAVHTAAIAEATSSRGFLTRILTDFQPADRPVDAAEQLRSLASSARNLWEREVFVVDDRSITLGKLLLASVMFILAFSASRALSRLIWVLLFKRAFEPGAALAFQSLTFYALLVAFFLLALRTVNIPLTAFALLGGALAIGLGFGSQTVIGNFIGGLILLVERPIKVGDVVDVEGVTGVIDRVGPRSTQIRTFDNLHIIVPNSLLLEQKVVNWTLSDDTVRRQIAVGVAYDAPVREVGKLILRAIDEHGRVLAKPDPKVFFQDFGDNSLVFRAYFWLRLDPNTSFLEIESDLRHRIFHLFKEAGITIAFPQRDIHFDAAQPIEVRMLPTNTPEP